KKVICIIIRCSFTCYDIYKSYKEEHLMHTFTAEETPASIVKVFPKASDLFKERRINFCCNGDRPLKEVFSTEKHDSEAVLSELNTAYSEWQKSNQKSADWYKMPLSDPVDYSVNTHLAYLKEELAPLETFVTKIYNVHGERDPQLVKLPKLYNEFKLLIETHMINEENNVFPLIKKYEVSPNESLKLNILGATSRMAPDHETSFNIIKQMRAVTSTYEPPLNACGSYRVTYARLKDL